MQKKKFKSIVKDQPWRTYQSVATICKGGEGGYCQYNLCPGLMNRKNARNRSFKSRYCCYECSWKECFPLQYYQERESHLMPHAIPHTDGWKRCWKFIRNQFGARWKSIRRTTSASSYLTILNCYGFAIDLFAMDLLSICLLWIRIRIWAHPQRILIHLSGESKNAIRLPIGDILAELHHF